MLLGFVISVPPITHAQDFEQGLQYYQQKDYEKAIAAFNSLEDPSGYLFTAKSFYALGKYDNARANLNKIPDEAPPKIRYEAIYTSALIHFQQENFARSLSKLHKISNSNMEGDLLSRASQLYEQILNYLSFDQRTEAIEELSSAEVKYDILETGLDKSNVQQAQNLYATFQDHTDEEKWTEKAEKFESYLSSPSSFKDKYGNPAQKLTPPEGTIYNIGVALPKFKPSDQEFDVVKAMYFGAMIAAQNFNDNNRAPKAYVQFINTASSDEGLQDLVGQFIDKHQGDAIVGPLFSEQAEQMVSVATDTQIPTLAPLANSQLDVENSFLFQANPTFKMHGKQMARYAVKKMGHKNFAVFASANTSGAQSAKAFRREANRLGANVKFYVVEDLQSNKFEIQRYTKQLNSKGLIDAIYAPFTGRQALSLIDLLILDLRSMGMSPDILGSQEYQNLDFSARKYRDWNIFFSVGTHQSNRRGADRYQFKNTYEQKFGSAGNQYAMIGYDVTSFLLQALKKVGNPGLLREALSNQQKYIGLVRDINFDGGNINQAVKFFKVTDSGDTRAKY